VSRLYTSECAGEIASGDRNPTATGAVRLAIDLTDTDVRARDSLVRIGDSTRTRGPSTGRRAVRANASTTRGLCRRGFHRREIPAPGDMRVVGRSLGLWRVTPRQAAALGWTGRMCVLLWIDSSAPWAVRLYPTELAAHVLCRSVLLPCH
jgi:hypothetical protein